MQIQKLLGYAIMVLGAILCQHTVWAQGANYPEKPIKLIVPYAPGGPTDLVARTVASSLSQQLRQSVVVENRVGAGGVIGTNAVVNAPADGYTLLLGLQGPITINPALTKVPYDPFRDLVAVRMIASAPMVLMASKNSGITKLSDLIAASKVKATGLNIGSSGNGTLPHVAAELLRHQSGANLIHVPYKGAGPAMVDLTAGHIDLQFGDLQAALPFIQSGQVIALAVTTPARSSKLPQTPTMVESGFGNIRLAGWYGLFAPKNTPSAVVTRINLAMDGVFRDTAFKQFLDTQGAQASSFDNAHFIQFLHDEYEQWVRLGKAIEINMN